MSQLEEIWVTKSKHEEIQGNYVEEIQAIERNTSYLKKYELIKRNTSELEKILVC